MTSQEARQQVDACESQVVGTFSELKDAVRSMESSASQAQSSSTTTKTMLPLIISLVGLFLCSASHPVWGVLLIIAGIFLAYTAHDDAVSVQKNVETQVGYLNNTLDNNSKI
jgi:hypothetical protein